jgi:hypothetical protein
LAVHHLQGAVVLRIGFPIPHGRRNRTDKITKGQGITMTFAIGDKASRVMRFLFGLRNPAVATALASYGFTDKDMAEGWELVHGLGKGKLAILPAQPRDMEVLLKLDAWENHWFPVSSASLERRFPQVFERFFLNLQQAEGPEVAVTVRTFVDRYDELTAADSKYGPDGAKAKELLTSRGVTPAVVEEARNLLTQLTKVPVATISAATIAEQEAELARAEDVLWAWYLEWSKLARVAIKQRPLLRQLGFLSTRRTGEDEEELSPNPAVGPASGSDGKDVAAAAAAR